MRVEQVMNFLLSNGWVMTDWSSSSKWGFTMKHPQRKEIINIVLAAQEYGGCSISVFSSEANYKAELREKSYKTCKISELEFGDDDETLLFPVAVFEELL